MREEGEMALVLLGVLMAALVGLAWAEHRHQAELARTRERVLRHWRAEMGMIDG